MLKEELASAIADINEELEELRKEYEPYIGLEFDTLSEEDQKRVQRIWTLLPILKHHKERLQLRALYDYHVFIM